MFRLHQSSQGAEGSGGFQRQGRRRPGLTHTMPGSRVLQSLSSRSCQFMNHRSRGQALRGKSKEAQTEDVAALWRSWVWHHVARSLAPSRYLMSALCRESPMRGLVKKHTSFQESLARRGQSDLGQPTGFLGASQMLICSTEVSHQKLETSI